MTEATATDKPRRRWARLSVRGLMLLVLVVGGGIGWKANRASYQRRAVAAIKEGGGQVAYDFQRSPDLVLNLQARKLKEPPAPRWLRKWIGDEYFQEVVDVTFYDKEPTPELLAVVAGLDRVTRLSLYKLSDAAGLVHLREMGRLTSIHLEGTGITDAALDDIVAARSLEGIAFDKARLTDAGVAQLLGLQRLFSVQLLEIPGLTDAGVARLAELPGLRSLRVLRIKGVGDLVLAAIRKNGRVMEGLTFDGCTVTDAGLANVEGMTSLKGLNIQMSQVTNAGLSSIRGLVNLETLNVNVRGGGEIDLDHFRRLKKLNTLLLGPNIRITEAGMACLDDKVELETLSLHSPGVRDADLAHLEGLVKLGNLGLYGTAVTDAGLVHLYPLKMLKRLDVRDTKVTPEAIAKLRSILPTVRVQSGPIVPRKPPAAAPSQK